MTHVCPLCEETIEGDSDALFEQRWEAHKATHKEAVEETVDEALPVPTDAELGAAKDAAVKEANFLASIPQSNDEALWDLEKHFAHVSAIEHKIPQLIDFGFKMANAMGNWAKEKDYRTRAIKGGLIYWTPAGDIASEFLYDKYNLSVEEEPEYLKRGYARLPKLHAQYPAVFELIMTLGEHLTNIMQNRRMSSKDISFTNLHNFVSNTGIDMWAFKILNRKRVIRTSKVAF